MEPRIFSDRLWIVGMPGTQKFRDLGRDPRFCLHTAVAGGHMDVTVWRQGEPERVVRKH